MWLDSLRLQTMGGREFRKPYTGTKDKKEFLSCHLWKAL